MTDTNKDSKIVNFRDIGGIQTGYGKVKPGIFL
ncbi:hypothetical protein JOC36_000733 [Weissella uvarum]|nr:tyrosine-protein phosphatase [Weissella uvarum]MBM7617184.1 hypothetical protein [Weissella uvarum]